MTDCFFKGEFLEKINNLAGNPSESPGKINSGNSKSNASGIGPHALQGHQATPLRNSSQSGSDNDDETDARVYQSPLPTILQRTPVSLMKNHNGED